MFIVWIFSNESWKTFFLSIFLIGLCLNDNLLWMLAPGGKNNTYLGKFFHMFMHCLTYMCSVCTLCV